MGLRNVAIALAASLAAACASTPPENKPLENAKVIGPYTVVVDPETGCKMLLKKGETPTKDTPCLPAEQTPK
jgi:hypothetical protein